MASPGQPLKQLLHSAGVTDPDHEAAAAKAHALGADAGEILGWVRDHGPEVLAVAGRLADLAGLAKEPGAAAEPPPPVWHYTLALDSVTGKPLGMTQVL